MFFICQSNENVPSVMFIYKLMSRRSHDSALVLELKPIKTDQMLCNKLTRILSSVFFTELKQYILVNILYTILFI